MVVFETMSELEPKKAPMDRLAQVNMYLEEINGLLGSAPKDKELLEEYGGYMIERDAIILERQEHAERMNPTPKPVDPSSSFWKQAGRLVVDKMLFPF
jgi:hypothetical protein